MCDQTRQCEFGQTTPGQAMRDYSRIRGVALEVATRLSDPERVRTAADFAMRQSQLPQPMQWHSVSLAQGDCGLAVAMAAFDTAFPDGAWDRAGKQYLEHAVLALKANSSRGPSLFSGAAGVAFAAHLLSRSGTRYTRLLQSLDGLVATALANLSSRIRSGDPMPVAVFDLISGLSGVCAYATARRSASQEFEASLQGAIDALCDLALDDARPPLWSTPHRYIGRDADAYPFGNLNFGLAHGIPGMLAVLAIYSLNGGLTPRLDQAIAHIISILKRYSLQDQWGMQWPAAIALTNEHGELAEAQPTRNAWCYGVPGIARALWLGGAAVADEDAKQISVQSLKDVFARPKWARNIDSPSICHGISGLLMVAHSFELDGYGDEFEPYVDMLIGEIIDDFDEASMLGFRSIEMGTNRVDQPGLLDGAAGIAATLLSILDPSSAGWQRAFCIR